ncbi:DUF2254 domain-containing protein [soil metagenome]
MKTWLLSRWDHLRGTFWFVPLLMVIGAVALSLMMLTLDKAAAERGLELSLAWTFTRGPAGSRALLATVAGSMITIASVCFSITIVALQQASSQFGPRLLYNFMRDRGNQVVLGTFIAGFTYCLLILRTVNGTEDDLFVPHLSVTVGLLLALAGVAVLIYYVHHAASSIQAEHVIAGVSKDLGDAIQRLFPAKLGAGPENPDPETLLPTGFSERALPVNANSSDYLQAVDVDRLMGLATAFDLVLELARRPGQFIVRGSPLVRVWPPDRVTEEVAKALQGAFYLGSRRTLFQDAEFAVDQLVEVALRALSPGINDPFTALACVDRLGAALADLADKQIPSPYRHDETGTLRVVAAGVTSAGIVDAAIHQIRQTGRGNTAVTLRLLEMIAAVAPQVRAREMRDALLAQAKEIFQGSQEALPAEMDRVIARERYQAALTAFGIGMGSSSEETS